MKIYHPFLYYFCGFSVNSNLTWKTLTHNATSLNSGTPSDTDSPYMIIIQNSEHIKVANELIIPSLCGYRGTNLLFVRNAETVTNISSYTTQAGYELCYRIIVNFSRGDITAYCTNNTWGLSTIPMSIGSNTILYR